MKKIAAIIAILLLAALIFTLAACTTDNTNAIDYSVDNNFEVDSFEDGENVYFAPKDVAPSYGLLFYVGTVIAPSYYEYLGNALAKQGYLTVIPKQSFAFSQYRVKESVFEKYPDVKFFVGGHSQGGGAAVRRAQDMPTSIAGVVLFAPICFTHVVYNENGELDGYEYYNLHGANIPTLLLVGEGDAVLNEEQKQTARDCLDSNSLEYHVITPGTHMSFSTMDNDDAIGMMEAVNLSVTLEQREAQRTYTLQYTLAFLKSVVLGNFAVAVA